MTMDDILSLPLANTAPAPTEHYLRGESGQWMLSPDVDAADSGIRAVLKTPNGPIALRIETTIDGKPFRAIREELIDSATESTSTTPATSPATPKTTDGVDTEEVAPTTASKSGVLVRLGKHFRNRLVDRDEARWLLSEWTPGSPVLALKHSFVAERAQLSPVFTALDADRNGGLSGDEIENAKDRFASLDRDEDGVIERSELTSGAESKNDAFWRSMELLTHVEAADSTASDPGGRITQEQFDALPAIELRATLGKSAKGSVGLELIGIDSRIANPSEFETTLSATDDALVIQRPKYRIEIVACQSANYASFNGQVSIGAVIDGLPLWRDLDADGDGRLERKERAHVDAILNQRDFDQNGTVDPAEIRTPIRLAIGCGPQVHKELAQPVSAIRKPSKTAGPMPGWFVGMDRNEDDELSRAEFIGTDEQFLELDSDQDGIIGAIDIKEKQ